LPKIDWVQPTIEFLSPTFTEFLLFFATLILLIASWEDLHRTLVLTFDDRATRLMALRILNEIEVHLDLLALAFWTSLWRPMGAFPSSPLLVVALILKEHLLQTDPA
jgi:predicted PurR-regulated permease PerM